MTTTIFIWRMDCYFCNCLLSAWLLNFSISTTREPLLLPVNNSYVLEPFPCAFLCLPLRLMRYSNCFDLLQSLPNFVYKITFLYLSIFFRTFYNFRLWKMEGLVEYFSMHPISLYKSKILEIFCLQRPELDILRQIIKDTISWGKLLWENIDRLYVYERKFWYDSICHKCVRS